MSTEYYYRFEEQRYAAPLDEYGMPSGKGRVVLHLRKLKVVKRTPKGVKLAGLNYSYTNPRLVLYNSHKKFACATREEAWQSFVARKTKQIRIFKARIDDAQEALALVGRFEEGQDW
jgi:hypothetical protein